eukprot:6466615-Amphidinium_carterae.1
MFCCASPTSYLLVGGALTSMSNRDTASIVASRSTSELNLGICSGCEEQHPRLHCCIPSLTMTGKHWKHTSFSQLASSSFSVWTLKPQVHYWMKFQFVHLPGQMLAMQLQAPFSV